MTQEETKAKSDELVGLHKSATSNTISILGVWQQAIIGTERIIEILKEIPLIEEEEVTAEYITKTIAEQTQILNELKSRL
jgi:hypothetical protein